MPRVTVQLSDAVFKRLKIFSESEGKSMSSIGAKAFEDLLPSTVIDDEQLKRIITRKERFNANGGRSFTGEVAAVKWVRMRTGCTHAEAQAHVDRVIEAVS